MQNSHLILALLPIRFDLQNRREPLQFGVQVFSKQIICNLLARIVLSRSARATLAASMVSSQCALKRINSRQKKIRTEQSACLWFICINYASISLRWKDIACHVYVLECKQIQTREKKNGTPLSFRSLAIQQFHKSTWIIAFSEAVCQRRFNQSICRLRFHWWGEKWSVFYFGVNAWIRMDFRLSTVFLFVLLKAFVLLISPSIHGSQIRDNDLIFSMKWTWGILLLYTKHAENNTQNNE